MDFSFIIEKNKRMSKSMLWKLQSAAYCQFGPNAWSLQGVPFYVTSNPFTARTYAQIVLGYLRDCIAKEGAASIDLSKPLYIFDLGAGTGRFGYLFLKELKKLLITSDLLKIKLCYVMTDIAEQNIAFLQNHPSLQSFIKEGLLDFSYFHHADQKPLQLLLQKQALGQKSIVNPVILIGNYFFDTIPQDLFLQSGGKLKEGRVSIAIDRPPQEFGDPIDSNPSLISHMQCAFDYAEIENVEDYYPDCGNLSNFLQHYAQLFPSASFQFPIGAFQTIQYFSMLCQKSLLLLAGDQGVASEEQVLQYEPAISLHGTFSIPVNYHAISHYFRRAGGFGLLTSFPDKNFVVIAAVLGGKEMAFLETALAFRTCMDYFEPADYWKIGNFSESGCRNASLEHLFLLLKLGNWDPLLFHTFFNRIQKLAPQASREERFKLQKCIGYVFENFYPVCLEEGNFIMNLGVILFLIGSYQEALVFFQRSLDIMGSTPMLQSNINACKKAIQNTF